jgi:hypothetical protein
MSAIRSFVFLTICLLAGPIPGASSAEFKANLSGYAEEFDKDFSIRIDGEIEVGDHKKLLDVLANREVQKGLPIYLDLNSTGGNFEEAIKIAKLALDKMLSTRLGKNSECLSACAIIFMAGTRFTTVGSSLERRMHPGAKLGFHAPTLQIPSEASNSEQISGAYDAAVDAIGSELLALARFRGTLWNNPLMKPDLINEMMLRRGRNFFYIDTIRKVIENDIELDDAVGPRVTANSVMDACANFLAMRTSGKIADDNSYDVTEKVGDASARTANYKIGFVRGGCTVSVEGGHGAVKIIEGYGTDEGVTYGASAWQFWPGTKRLESVPTSNQKSTDPLQGDLDVEFDELSPKPQSELQTTALPQPEAEPAPPPPFIPGLGYSWDYRTRREGERRAMQECKGSCRIALWFHHACGAIAMGERGGWGTGWHGNRNRAAQGALSSCNQVDANCSVKQTICSPSGYGAIAVQNNP